jgi:hypothetical protein
MRRIGMLLGVAIWFSATGVQAQDDAPTPFATEEPVESPYQSPSVITQEGSDSSHISWGQLQPTASMWLYEQEKQDYLDPKLAVRRKAARKTAERQARIASMKWYGMSNSRPVANPTPFCGIYAPGWHANSYDSFRWTYNGGYPLTVTRPASLQFSAAYGIW